MKQKESYYQKKFAKTINGQIEYVLSDQARVDIVTDTFAIEVDFGEKWAESIGQSLFYSTYLKKKAGVLLIVNGTLEDRFVKRLMSVASYHNITVWIVDYNTDIIRRVNVFVNYSYW
jgi:hypothetical protein